MNYNPDANYPAENANMNSEPVSYAGDGYYNSENIDDAIAAFNQIYDKKPPKQQKKHKNQIVINGKKKKKAGKIDANEQTTERIVFQPAPPANTMAPPEQGIESTKMLTSMSRYFSVGSSINIGKRKSQQDAIALSNNDFDNPCMENRVFGILSDGMGGMKGGEKASAICTARMMKMFESVDLSDFAYYIEKCYDSIDAEIADLQDSSGAKLGAGATMIVFYAIENKLFWASVGDSHLYIINKNGIRRLNREHNYMLRLRAMVESGEITIEQANSNKQKEALISYMGMNGLELIDISETPLIIEPGDVVLACSDGMYRALSDAEIDETVRYGINDIPLLANILVNKTLDKQLKYQDNVSVIIAKKL